MTLAEQWRREGRAEGLEQGLLEGQRASLRKLLVLEFGSIPAEYETRVHAADAEAIDRWIVRVLTAANIDVVFAR